MLSNNQSKTIVFKRFDVKNDRTIVLVDSGRVANVFNKKFMLRIKCVQNIHNFIGVLSTKNPFLTPRQKFQHTRNFGYTIVFTLLSFKTFSFEANFSNEISMDDKTTLFCIQVFPFPGLK